MLSAKRMLKRWIKRGLHTPLSLPIQWSYRGLGTCLMYHRICRDDAYPEGAGHSHFYPNLELMVRASDFDRQMEHIQRHYRCVSVPNAIEELSAGSLKRDSILVTFDDGSFDCLELALPILKKHGVPATIYLATGIVEQTASLWWYEQEQIFRELDSLEFHWRGKHYAWVFRDSHDKQSAYNEINDLFKELPATEQSDLMHILRKGAPGKFSYADQLLTWDQVRMLDREPLITIGAHTHNHLVLAELSTNEARQEIQKSKAMLESQLGHVIEHFAYPFGGEKQAGAREFELVRELGFKSAFTTRTGHLFGWHQDRLFALPRVAIGFHDDHENFRWKLSGLESAWQNPLGSLKGD